MTTSEIKAPRPTGRQSRPKVRILSGLYTFAESAERLGIGLAQAYRLDNEGKYPVPVIYLGAVRKVRIAELEAFLQGSAPQPAPGCPMSEEEIAEGLANIA